MSTRAEQIAAEMSYRNCIPSAGEQAGFIVKDSGERQHFDSGMVRDTEKGKLDYTVLFDGPMPDRYVAHLTKAKEKYPDDPETGQPNWTKAAGFQEFRRARRSLLRHVRQLLRGDRDEDHAAAVWFNVNLLEYCREQMELDRAFEQYKIA